MAQNTKNFMPNPYQHLVVELNSAFCDMPALPLGHHCLLRAYLSMVVF